MTKLEEIARAIGRAPTISVRTNKARTDGCMHEVIKAGNHEPVLLEAFRYYEEAIRRARVLGLEHFARAAVAALREPSHAMDSAGADVDIHTDFDEDGRCVGGAAREVWQAMIDAILADKP